MAANLFPAFIKLSGRPCLVVGAGAIAEAKITSLLEADARVTVVAPNATQVARELAASGRITWLPRPFSPSDLDGAFLVVAATSKDEVNRAVYLEAQARGVLSNSVDDPPNCDFYFPAVVRRGALQIAISTSGESPALAQRLRLEIEEGLDESFGEWVQLIGAARREIRGTLPQSEQRKRLLHDLASCDSHEKWKAAITNAGRDEPFQLEVLPATKEAIAEPTVKR
jgi:precorrin-2 dehydrogenase / sirohydrochlorin ferrochelatase